MTGRNKRIRIDESTDRRVIKSGLEVIEPGLGIEVVAPVAEGIDISQVTV